MLARITSTILEVAGFAAATCAAWLFDMRIGLVAAGLSLIILSLGVDAAPSAPDGT